MSNIIKLQDVRIAFANLWTPEAIRGAVGADANKKRYGLTAIIPPNHPSVPKVEERIKELALEKWKGNAGPMLAEMVQRGAVCFSKSPKRSKSGDIYDGFEGNYWLSANRAEKQGPPDVFDADKSKLTGGGRPYNGSVCNVFVDLWIDTRFEKRVVASLIAVQFRRDAPPFAGSPARVNPDDLDAGVADHGEVTGAVDLDGIL